MKMRTLSSAAGAGQESGQPPKATRRQQRTEEIHNALFRAAILTVGEFGYANSTIQMITRKARVANGTFYNYFASQQELFEQLLPELGERLRAFVDERIREAADFLEVEQVLLRSLFDFSYQNPEFYRILTEAETLVPDAHRRYILDMTDWYVNIIANIQSAAGPNKLDEKDREILALTIIAAHHYLTLRYTRWVGGEGTVPEWVVQSYLGLISRALSLGAPSPEAKPPRIAARGRQADRNIGAETVKFIPSVGSGRPYSNISAVVAPLDCRSRLLEDGSAIVELDLSPNLLSSVGTGTGALITSIAEVASITAVCLNREEMLSLKVISLSCSLIRTVQDGTLVAHAVRENSGRNLRFVSVRITRNGDEAQLIANVSVVIRVSAG